MESWPFYDFDGEPIGFEEWRRAWEDTEGRQVARTELDGGVRISTVWLGIDYGFGRTSSPLVFETMIFGGELDGKTWRWPTLGAAIAGHDQAVAQARDGARV